MCTYFYPEGSCCLLSDKVTPLMRFHALFKMIFSLPLRKLLSFIAFVFPLMKLCVLWHGNHSIFAPVAAAEVSNVRN